MVRVVRVIRARRVGRVQLPFQGVDLGVQHVEGGQVHAACGETWVLFGEGQGETVQQCLRRACPFRRDAGDVRVLGDHQQAGAVGGEQAEDAAQCGNGVARAGVHGLAASVSSTLQASQPHHGVRGGRARPMGAALPQYRHP
ncbi:hypothetical protein, partial [Streptomyces sp. T21Q-yed]|uniref:hypothetical protein n=1 Tax=Streptomyces sp. T21Q-yed TaxID=3018441 RepID=UPI0023DEEBA4